MNEIQTSISMGQAINIASELILKNEFSKPRDKELTAMELSAMMKASVPHIFALIKECQQSAVNTGKAVESVSAKPQNIVSVIVPTKPEFTLD